MTKGFKGFSALAVAALLFIFLTVTATLASASGLYSFSDIGPLKISVSDKEVEEIILNPKRQSSFYKSAYEFSALVGHQFGQLVESNLSPTGITTVVVAMGGAEHLGTLLENYFERYGIRNRVEFKYIELSRKNLLLYEDHFDENFNLKAGLMPFPSNYEKTRQLVAPHKIFENQKVIVVDTGFKGSIAEAVATVAKLEEYKGAVEGVMLAHTEDKVHHAIPVYALTDGLSGSARQRLVNWAFKIDENNVEGKTFDKVNAFQRSTFEFYFGKKLSILDSWWHRRRYQETLVGLNNGLAYSLRHNPYSCKKSLAF